jgi:hypothetical protein
MVSSAANDLSFRNSCVNIFSSPKAAFTVAQRLSFVLPDTDHPRGILGIELAQEVLQVAPDELSQLFDHFTFGHAVNLDGIFNRVRVSAQAILRYNAGTRRPIPDYAC